MTTAPDANAQITGAAASPSWRAALVKQFGHPTGLVGRLAGWIMATRPSNRQRNAWTVGLLSLQPGEHVLEVGFGPGLSLAHAAAAVGPSGTVTGIDRSAVMLRQAARRNRRAIADGRMALRIANVEALREGGDRFDAILAVNVVGFWLDRRGTIEILRARLAPGGRLAITVQPRSKGATADTTRRVGAELERDLEAAGFAAVRSERLALDPPAVCVMGTTA
jgi:SAM-dependent methyltransferase